MLVFSKKVLTSVRFSVYKVAWMTKFTKVRVCSMCVPNVGGIAVYEGVLDDLFQTAASLTGHH